MLYIVLFVWLCLCLFVSFLAKRINKNQFLSIIVSLLFSPVIGLFYVLLSSEDNSKNVKTHNLIHMLVVIALITMISLPLIGLLLMTFAANS